MAKKTVRLTLSEEPWEVDEDEIPGLAAQGLLAPEPESRAKPGKPPAGGKTTDGA